jgi:hypothetical protein
MLKTPRRRNLPSQLSSGKRALRLSRETIRTLAEHELPLAIGGSCPTGSWPSDTTHIGINGGC